LYPGTGQGTGRGDGFWGNADIYGKVLDFFGGKLK
jgi:hypothetical protein